MDMLTKILIAASLIGLLSLIIGTMRDNGKLSTFGLISFILGVLILFSYKFIAFVTQFQ